MYYIPDENNKPQPVSISEYISWKESLPEEIQTGLGFKVARMEVEDILVSTVYLGLDHSYGRTDTPVLWETMVFCPGEDDQYCKRASSLEEALEIHEKFCLKYIPGYKVDISLPPTE